jgi:DNA-binding NarL/FixJ family response regulator
MKFLVVDDHALIRDAMHDLLEALQPGAKVLTAATAAQARRVLAGDPEIGLVLLDLNLPDADGLELLADWADEYPSTAVVVLSGNHDPATARAALAGGASGFIPKSDSREVLSRALALVLAGGVYVPAFALQHLGATLSQPSVNKPVAGVPTPESLGLTARQLEVLALMVQGRSNKLIGRALNLAEPTVKNHVTALLRALQVGSRTEAVVAVTAWGWRMPPPQSQP